MSGEGSAADHGGEVQGQGGGYENGAHKVVCASLGHEQEGEEELEGQESVHVGYKDLFVL